MLDGKGGVRARRRFSIVGYVGPNGSGKSLAAVADCLPSLEAGRPVLSTVRLLDYLDPRPCDDPDCEDEVHPDHQAAHPLWLPFRTWDDLLAASHCDVLMDEVAGVASARQSQGLPGPVEVFLQKLRKADLRLRWTAPSWARADRIIRECTEAAAMCRGYMPRKVAGRDWPSNSVLRVRLLDAATVEDLTQGVVKSAKPHHVSWSRLEALQARHAYDTLGRVMSLPLIEGGRCVACGGRRSVPACSCDDAPKRGRAGVPAGVARRAQDTAHDSHGDRARVSA